MRLLISFVLLVACVAICLGQGNAPTQVYRGTIGQQAVVVKLQRDGDKLTGSYVYERVGQAIKLTGRVDAAGGVTLQEFDAAGRQTGKFTGKFGSGESADDFALSGTWTRPDGSRESYFNLSEQYLAFKQANLQVVSKTITDRRFNIHATYPQLAGNTTPAALAFNRAAAARTTKLAADFKTNADPPNHMALETDYNVLLANDDLISVELTDYEDFGGAHPNNGYATLNYDLHTGRPLQLAALFKQGVKYEPVLQRAVIANLQAQVRRLAAENKEQPDETLFTEDSAQEWQSWGMTPRGLTLYLDLPHVIAVFDKVFVPWSAVQDILDPQGPAAQFARASRK